MAATAISNINELIDAQYGITTYEVETTLTIAGAGSVTQVVKNAPNRIALLVANLVAGGNIFCRPLGQQPSASIGIPVGAGQILNLNWRDDQELVAREWNIYNDTAATPIYILERFIRSKPTEPSTP
jgi:hypothetical protein